MASAADQFRNFTGLEDPDPSLGLENVETKTDGEPVDTGDTLGHDEVEDAHVDGGESDKDTAPVAEGGTTQSETVADARTDETGNTGESDTGEEEPSYSDLKVADLKEQISLRNQERDEDSQIVPEEPGNKAELVAALEADDAAAAGGSDE